MIYISLIAVHICPFFDHFSLDTSHIHFCACADCHGYLWSSHHASMFWFTGARQKDTENWNRKWLAFTVQMGLNCNYKNAHLNDKSSLSTKGYYHSHTQPSWFLFNLRQPELFMLISLFLLFFLSGCTTSSCTLFIGNDICSPCSNMSTFHLSWCPREPFLLLMLWVTWVIE